jgi:hypothetical protein
MNTTHFTVDNGSKQFDESNCPPGIRGSIEKAIRRGKETSGCVVGGGLIWRWEAGHGRQDSVLLTLEGDREEYLGVVEVPRSKWDSFTKSARARGMTPTDFLITVLAEFIRINNDVGYEEAVALLFGEHREERTYYVGARPEVSAAPMYGRVE